MRVGTGVDVHAFSADTPLWLGCLQWPGEAGLAGHSDGDAVAHALCDAMFSAAGLGDMGSNFGTDRPEFANASGEQFLVAAEKALKSAGFSLINASVTVIGNAPKIAPRRAEIQQRLSQILNCEAISVSGTTTDGLGFTGNGEGIAVIATVLVAANA